MQRIAIIEDERFWSAYLSDNIDDWNNGRYHIEVCIYANGTPFLADLSAGKVFDLVFMDLFLGDGEEDGIQVLRRAKSIGWRGQAVILSSLKEFEFAKAGYLLGVKDYWNKPISNDCLHAFLNYYFCDKHITFKRNGQNFVLPFAQVTYLQKYGKNVDFHTIEKGIFSIPGTIKRFSEVLPYHFAQCERSHIVNLHHVDYFFAGGNVYLTTGEKLPYCKTFTESFKAAYAKFLPQDCLYTPTGV